MGVDEGVEVGVDGSGVVVVELLDGQLLGAGLEGGLDGLGGGLDGPGGGLGGGLGGDGLLVVGVVGGGVLAGGGDVRPVEDPEPVHAGGVPDGVGLSVVADVGVLWTKIECLTLSLIYHLLINYLNYIDPLLII